eukprot:gene13464-17876_t
MNAKMRVIAEGNLGEAIDYTERNDEIGDMAKALQVFKDNGLRVRAMEAEQKEQEVRTATQRKSDMMKLAGEFEAAVGEIVNTVSSASTQLEASATTLTATAPADAAADHVVQVQLAGHVGVDQAGHIDREAVRAHQRALDPLFAQEGGAHQPHRSSRPPPPNSFIHHLVLHRP